MKTLITLTLATLTILSTTASATERDRGGGLSVKRPDGSLMLLAEGTSVDFDEYTSRPLDGGKERVLARGTKVYDFYTTLFAKYSVSEPGQLLNFIDRQIIYAEGVTCVRYFQAPWPDRLQDIYRTPQPADKYWCEFLMDLHNGRTNAVGVPEPRARMGASNGNN